MDNIGNWFKIIGPHFYNVCVYNICKNVSVHNTPNDLFPA